MSGAKRATALLWFDFRWVWLEESCVKFCKRFPRTSKCKARGEVFNKSGSNFPCPLPPPPLGTGRDRRTDGWWQRAAGEGVTVSLGRGEDRGEAAHSPALGFGPPGPGTPEREAPHGQRGSPVRPDRYCLLVPANLSGTPFPHLRRENNPVPCTGWR